MKEKFRLRCDLNTITDIEHMDKVADAIEQCVHLVPYHRYDYLFRGYHELTHGKIDEEVFFTLGDISSQQDIFSHARRAGLETVFAIEGNIADETLYIVEQNAGTYFAAKAGAERWSALQSDLVRHHSALLVV